MKFIAAHLLLLVFILVPVPLFFFFCCSSKHRSGNIFRLKSGKKKKKINTIPTTTTAKMPGSHANEAKEPPNPASGELSVSVIPPEEGEIVEKKLPGARRRLSTFIGKSSEAKRSGRGKSTSSDSIPTDGKAKPLSPTFSSGEIHSQGEPLSEKESRSRSPGEKGERRGSVAKDGRQAGREVGSSVKGTKGELESSIMLTSSETNLDSRRAKSAGRVGTDGKRSVSPGSPMGSPMAERSILASSSVFGKGFGKAPFGRRAQSATTAENRRQGRSLLGKGDVLERNADAVPTLEGGGGSGAVAEHQKRIQEEKKRLGTKIAEVPVGFQVDLPHHTELSSHHQWERLLQHVHKEFDMSCLTACLCPELDEDIAWNPDLLLVQLTSSLRDAAESRGPELGIRGSISGGFDMNGLGNDLHDVQLGQMSGGEVLRKRKEREVENVDAGASEAPGTAAEGAAGVKKSGSAAGAAGERSNSNHSGSPGSTRNHSSPKSVNGEEKTESVVASPLSIYGALKPGGGFGNRSGRSSKMDAGSPKGRSGVEARKKLLDKLNAQSESTTK